LQCLKKEQRKKVHFERISDLIFISINQSIMIIIIPDASGPLVVDFSFFVSSFSFFPNSLVVIEWLFLTFFLVLKNINLNDEAGEVVGKGESCDHQNE